MKEGIVYKFPGEIDRPEALKLALERRDDNLKFFERYRRTMPVVAARLGSFQPNGAA